MWRSSSVDGHPTVATSGTFNRRCTQLPPHRSCRNWANAGWALPRGPLSLPFDLSDYMAALVDLWETDLDNSPTWDHPLAVVPVDLSIFDTYTRRDVAHAGAGERPTDQDYAR